MKGVIIAGGSGNELRPLTDNLPKPLLRIMGKPVLEYSIQRMKDNGISSILIVTNGSQQLFKEYFQDGRKWGVNLEYINQEFDGIEGAILAAEDFVIEDNFILSYGDIICGAKIIARTINAAEAAGTDFSVAVTLQSDIRNYSIVSLNSSGLITHISDIVDQGKSHYVIAGVFLLSEKIFKYLKMGKTFNTCLNLIIESKESISAGVWNESWFDIGRPWDILAASSYLLEKLDETRISSGAYIESNVDIKGPVIIESGVEILNGTIIKGPVYISKDVFIGNNVLIRDHSEIGEGSKIGFQSEIRSSIVMNDVSIAGQSYIGDSIIGSDATIHSAVITTNKHLPKKPIMTSIGTDPIVEVEVPLTKFGAIIGPKSHIGVRSTLLPGTRVDTGVIVPPSNVLSGYIAN